MTYEELSRLARKYSIRKNPPREFAAGEFFQEAFRKGLQPEQFDGPDWRGIAEEIGLTEDEAEDLIEDLASWLGTPT